ncbi:hypothetical protein [Streptomyces sp. NBC_00996]|uniref:hypothetical protein n=1 Tax=Streptomyces sp. NBC_00996 TaxID=2903710 RepID=UPI00386F7FB1|nr:hypothetical protein OG390_32080 [Streptomyces sp. NBC_00996]
MSESYGEGDAEPSGDRGQSGREGVSRLPAELRALGRSLDQPWAAGSESMVERVLEQILAERIPVPVAEPRRPGERLRAVRRWARVRWRALTAGLCGVLTVLVLTPPVRAAVIDWFGFGGVEVRYDPSAVPSPGARVPGCGPSLTLAQAGRRAGFEPLVPGAFGTPDAVTVTREPKGRLRMSLCRREHGHTVRLDEYPASLDLGFSKTVREPPEWVSLGGDEDYGNPALWFPKPHLLSFWLIDADGDRFTRSERTAGPTLLWMHEGEVTLRLEGVASKARAVEIAKSLK